jgi:membrane protein
VHDALPAKAAEQISDEVETVLNQPKQGLLSIGLVLALWGASGGIAMTMSALDRAYDVERGRPYVKQRITAIFLTVAVATLILMTVILIPIGTTATRVAFHYAHHYANRYAWSRLVLHEPLRILWNVTRYSFGILFLVMAVSLLYHFGPSVKQRWRWMTPGAAFSIITWGLLGLIFRFYIDHFTNYDKTYGAVGGAVILLLTFYLDALVLLIGAEINSEIDFILLGLKPGDMDFRKDPASTPVPPAP